MLYDPADGSKKLQNVHSKRWTDPEEYAKITSQPKVPEKDDTVIRALRSGTVKDCINKELQAPHCIDSDGYKPGKSYLYGTVSDAEVLFDRLKGTGEPVHDKNENWSHKERVTNDTVVGMWLPREGEPEETHAAMIFYSKTGSHIYPRREEK